MSEATSGATPGVEARDVVAGYLPGVNILSGCNLAVHPGELFAVLARWQDRGDDPVRPLRLAKPTPSPPA